RFYLSLYITQKKPKTVTITPVNLPHFQALNNQKPINMRAILLVVLFSFALAGATAQKTTYRVRNLYIVYDSARMHRELGINTGRNEMVNHECTTTFTIDEDAHTLTGHIGFYCKECEKGFISKTLNFTVTKVSDGIYRATDLHDPNRGACNRCLIVVNQTVRAISFDFLYFFLGEQSTLFMMAPIYLNANGAIAAFDTEALTELLEKGIDVNVPYEFNGKNETPLNYVCDINVWKGKDQNLMAQMLLDKGADVNIPDKDGFTPLMKTIQSGDLALYSILLQYKADRNAKAKDGTTALKLAKAYQKNTPKGERIYYVLEDIIKSLKN
ncbi:MAG: ankyrin repeat domain-containing protein, partial [Mucilaginibacter sp.]